jgi:hypothetical protein
LARVVASYLFAETRCFVERHLVIGFRQLIACGTKLPTAASEEKLPLLPRLQLDEAMNKTRPFVIGLFALFGMVAGIGCGQEQQAMPRPSTGVRCVDGSSGSPINEACAIEVAKAEIVEREGKQPYRRFSADYDAKDATWAVMAVFEPEKPGGHVFILVSSEGKVLNYALGR